MNNYRVGNWSKYNRNLKKRGSLTIWVSENAIESWMATRPDDLKGRPNTYSDQAILCAMIVKIVFGLAYRQTEGFLCSLFDLMGVDLPVPDYTRICRRGKTLTLPKNLAPGSRPKHLVVDSTGFKVYGEGEWHTRTHGKSKRRRWKKFHVGICPDTHEIITAKATELEEADCQVFPEIVQEAPRSVKKIGADGAYDTSGVYRMADQRGITPCIPPRENAVLDKNSRDYMEARDDAIRIIEGLGGDSLARKIWKKLTGYHVRSLVETAMSRLKRTFGGALFSRKNEAQNVELQLKGLVMNMMTRTGMPAGYMI